MDVVLVFVVGLTQVIWSQEFAFIVFLAFIVFQFRRLSYLFLKPYSQGNENC